MSRKSKRGSGVPPSPPLPPAPNPGREGRRDTPPAPNTGGGGGHSLLFALLAASLLLSLLFALRVPLDGNPDEKAHLEYIKEMVAQRGFVKFVPDPTYRLAEVHQPPLYYLLCVPVYLATGGSLVAVRLVAALAQLATIALTFFACRDLFARRPYLAVGAAAFVTFLPTQAQLGGAVNNDPLTTLISVAIFWRLGRLVVREETPGVRDAGLIGLLLGAGLLTKTSVLQLVPALFVAYVIAARAGRLTWAQAAVQAGGALALGLLIASPWLIRNQMLYGDPLALSIYTQTGPNYTPAQIMQGAGWTFGDYIRNVGIRSFATFWYFLSPNLPFTRFAGPPLPLLVVLVLALGGILGVYRGVKGGTTAAAEDGAGERRVLLLFALGALLLLPFYARFVLTVFQAQGRYFLPALLPIAVLTGQGWTHFGEPRRRLLFALIPGGVLLILTLIQLSRGGYLA